MKEQSADSLWHLHNRIIDRLKEHVNGVGLTEEEIQDFLNELDRHRGGLGHGLTENALKDVDG